MTTCAEGAVDAGTVTVQVLWAGQLVGATCPLNVATIWPLELKKLAPEMVTLCPADPLAGLNEEITGGPAGAMPTVVEVDVEVGEGDVGDVGVEAGVDAPLLRGWVDGVWDGTAVGRTGGAAVGDDGPEPPASEMIRATAAATTRTAAVATLPINHRSRPVRAGVPGGGGAPAASCGADGRVVARGGATFSATGRMSTRLVRAWVAGGRAAGDWAVGGETAGDSAVRGGAFGDCTVGGEPGGASSVGGEASGAWSSG